MMFAVQRSVSELGQFGFELLFQQVVTLTYNLIQPNVRSVAQANESGHTADWAS